MALTKTTTSIFSAQALTPGPDINSSAIDISDSYKSTLFVRITNGTNAQTIAPKFRIEVSADTGSPTNWYDYGSIFIGPIDISTEVEFNPIEINVGIRHIRLVAIPPDASDATIDAEIVEITSY